MDSSSEQWIAELGIMEQLDQYSNCTLSSGSFSCTTDDLIRKNGYSFERRPTKLGKRTNSFDSFSSDDKQISWKPSSNNIFSNGCEGLKKKETKFGMGNRLIMDNVSTDKCFGVESMRLKSNILSHDNDNHAISERRRREKLGEKFAALSALIPDLKKMDKATVLGDAVKYMKHLQEQIKTLEEKAKIRQLDSTVFVKKFHLLLDDNDDSNSSSSNQQNSNHINCMENEVFPVIEVRIMDNKDVLITIHCERHCELLARILEEMEMLHLSIIGTNSMAFGDYDLVVTIAAQMKSNFSVTAKDIIGNLRKIL